MFGSKAREIARLREERDQVWEQRNEAVADRDEATRLASELHDRYERLHEAYKHLQQRMLTLHPDPPTSRPYLLDPPVEQWKRELLGGGS